MALKLNTISRKFVWAIALFLLSFYSVPVYAQTASDATEFTFQSADGITVFGDEFEHANGKDAPLVLLVHQGAHNSRTEYASIVPRLASEGYNIIMIDARRGGSRFGGVNRTVEAAGDTEYSYCDTYADLDGALDFAVAQGYTGPRVLWGSSFSATMVMMVAAIRSEEVNGVLSFSPASGDPMGECQPTDYFDVIDVPMILFRPPNEMESQRSQDQFALAEQHGHQTFAAEVGVHGSSMLNEERVGADVSANWDRALRFLSEVFGE